MFGERRSGGGEVRLIKKDQIQQEAPKKKALTVSSIEEGARRMVQNFQQQRQERPSAREQFKALFAKEDQ